MLSLAILKFHEKTISKFGFVAAVAAVMALAAPAKAATILAVDFGAAGLSLPQAGFTELLQTNATAPITQTFTGLSGVGGNDITLSFPQAGGRQRATPTNADPGNLYRDLFTQLAETTTGETLTISSLDANTAYQVEIWSLDTGFNNGSIFEWFNTTPGQTATSLGTITNNISAVPTDLTQFRITATLTANATGVIRLGHTDSIGSGTINGLRISSVSVVPEAGTLALFGGGILTGVGIIRRRRNIG